jgi:hypothetical protein
MSENKGKKAKCGRQSMCRRRRKFSDLPEDHPLRNRGYVVGGIIFRPEKKTIH